MASPKITDTVPTRGDEFFTQEKDVRSIAENLIDGLKIWCPFNDTNSYFPKVLREFGYDVVTTNTDFFVTDIPDGCNAIVSNPPFSRKKEVLKRCKELGVRFALILPFLHLNDGTPLDYGDQIILFRKRMYFIMPDVGAVNNPRTTCFVLSNGILKKDFTIVR